MKLLFVYQFCTVGGVETVLKSRLKALAREGIKFHVLFLYDAGGKNIFKEFSDYIIITNENKKIISLIEKEKYDCIINIDTPQIFNLLNMLSYDPVVILEVHTTYKENLAYLNQSEKIKISSIITPSKYMVTLIKPRIKKEIPIHIVPNTIDVQFLNPETSHNFNLKNKLVGWVGRLDDLKNWKEFINIALYLKSTSGDYHFLVAGGIGASAFIKAEFFSIAKSKGILPYLHWFPKIEYKLMPNLYKLISKSGGCFVSTSIDESFGMTVLESMGSKCPVVVPDVGGLTELTDNGSCGLLYPGGNIERAVLSVIKITTDIWQRETIIANAYEFVLANYTSERIVKNWINLIRSYIRKSD